MAEYFDLDYDYINPSTVYRKLDDFNYTYKKISHMKKECNSDGIKIKRYNLATVLLFCYQKKYHRIYLDESGFNISMTSQSLCTDREKKSSNYCYIVAIDYL